MIARRLCGVSSGFLAGVFRGTAKHLMLLALCLPSSAVSVPRHLYHQAILFVLRVRAAVVTGATHRSSPSRRTRFPQSLGRPLFHLTRRTLRCPRPPLALVGARSCGGLVVSRSAGTGSAKWPARRARGRTARPLDSLRSLGVTARRRPRHKLSAHPFLHTRKFRLARVRVRVRIPAECPRWSRATRHLENRGRGGLS